MRSETAGHHVCRVSAIAIAVVLLVSRSIVCFGGNAIDPRAKPGATFYVNFLQLGKTWAQKPTRIGIYIPKDYTSDRTFPLFVWFGGGFGSDSPGPARKITGDKGFVCVGVPYHWQDDGIPGGWKNTPWSYYKTMFDKLETIVPNINPKQRICGGFSSGGAAIMRQIQNSEGAFQEYFYAFMPGGAGWDMGGLKSIEGRPMLAFIGEKDSRHQGYVSIEKNGRSAGVDVKLLVFKGVGHSMPAQYYPQMREWMMKKVVLRDLARIRQDMKRQLSGRRWGKAFRLANEIRSMTGPGMPEHTEAEKTIVRLKPFGESKAKKLLISKATLAAMQQFVRDWKNCDFTKPVKEKCNTIAERQLEKILSRNPVSASYLKKFLALWDGFPASRQAMDVYDKMANEALAKIRSKARKSLRAQYLKRFITQWDPAPATNEARQLLGDLASEALAEIITIKSKTMRRSKLSAFARTYAGTPAATEAKLLLKDL